MAAEVQFVIDSIVMDAPIELFRIAINFQAIDIKEVDKRKGGASYPIDLPATKVNRDVINDVFILTQAGSTAYDFKSWHPAQFVRNGLPYLIGKVRLMSVEPASLRFEFITGNTSWFESIRDKRLQDLNLLDQDHDPSAGTFIVDSWTDFLDDNGTDYFYPLVDYGHFTGLPLDANLDLEYLYPATGMRRLMRQIMADSGYSLGGDFPLGGIFKRVVHQFSNPVPLHTQAWVDAHGIFVGMTADQIVPPAAGATKVEFNDDSSGSFFDTAGAYDAANSEWDPENMIARSNISISLTTSGNDTFRLSLYNSVGSLQVIAVIFKVGAGTETFTFEFDTTLNSNPPYYIAIESLSASGFTIEDDSTWLANPQPQALFGSTYQLNGWLPDITQGDYIKGIINHFNLYPVFDNTTQTVSFFTEDKFFLGEAYAEDWSDKINFLAPVVVHQVNDEYSQTLQLQAAVETQAFLKEPDNFNTRYQFDSGNAFKPGIDVINEAVFRATFMGKTFQNADRYAILPRMVANENQTLQFRNYGPHMLLVYGLADVDQITDSTYSFWTFNGVQYVDLPYAYYCKPYMHLGNLGPNLVEWQLSFNRGQFTGPQITPGGIGIGEIFWNRTLRMIRIGKVVECEAYLTEADIATLDFRKPKWIAAFNSYFYINKIEGYNPFGIETVKLELISIRSDGGAA